MALREFIGRPAAVAIMSILKSHKKSIDSSIKSINISGTNVTITKNDGTTETKNTQDTAYTHPKDDGSLHVPATGTGNNGKVLRAGAAAGSFSWDNLAKKDVGLDKVENVGINDQKPTYSVPAGNSDLVSGEALGTALGKIARAVSSLIKHLSDKENPHGVSPFVYAASAPAGDATKLWVNTSNHTLNYWNGTAWVTVVGGYSTT